MLKNRYKMPIGQRVNPFSAEMKMEKFNLEFKGRVVPHGLGATISWMVVVNLVLGYQFMMFVNLIVVIFLYLLLENESYTLLTELRLIVQSPQMSPMKKMIIYVLIFLNISIAIFFVSNPDILIIERILRAVQSPETLSQIYLTVFSNSSSIGGNTSFPILIANVIGMLPFLLSAYYSMVRNTEIYLKNICKVQIKEVRRYINLRSATAVLITLIVLSLIPSFAISAVLVVITGVSIFIISEKEARISFFGKYEAKLLAIRVRGDYLEMIPQFIFNTLAIEIPDFQRTVYPSNLYPPNSTIYSEGYRIKTYLRIGKIFGFILFIYLLSQVYREVPTSLVDAWVLFLQLLIIAITAVTFWLNVDRVFQWGDVSSNRMIYSHNSEVHLIRVGKKVWLIKSAGIEGISSQKNSLPRFPLIQLDTPAYGKQRLATYTFLIFLALITLFLVQWIRFGIINITGLSILIQFYFTSILESFVLSIINDKVGIVVLGIITWFFVVNLAVVIGRYFRPSVELHSNAGDIIQIQLPNLTSVQKAIYGASMTLKGDGVSSNRPGLYVVQINWSFNLRYKLRYGNRIIKNGDQIRVGVYHGKAQFELQLQSPDGTSNMIDFEVMRGQEFRRIVDGKEFISCRVVDVRN